MGIQHNWDGRLTLHWPCVTDSMSRPRAQQPMNEHLAYTPHILLYGVTAPPYTPVIYSRVGTATPGDRVNYFDQVGSRSDP